MLRPKKSGNLPISCPTQGKSSKDEVTGVEEIFRVGRRRDLALLA